MAHERYSSRIPFAPWMSRETLAISSAMSTLFILARKLLGEPRTVVLFLAEVVCQQLSLGDLTEHPRQLVLNELVGGDRIESNWMRDMA